MVIRGEFWGRTDQIGRNDIFEIGPNTTKRFFLPWLTKLLNGRALLLGFLNRDAGEDSKGLASQLLMLLPTNPTGVKEYGSQKVIIVKFEQKTSTWMRKFLLQVIARLLRDHDLSLVFPVILRQIAEGQTTKEILEIAEKTAGFFELMPIMLTHWFDGLFMMIHSQGQKS
jgi:hypothetical protein